MLSFFSHVSFSLYLFHVLSRLHHIWSAYFLCPPSSPWATSMAITGIGSGLWCSPDHSLRASTAGPMWRRRAYKLYPPGERSLGTMLLFTEFLQRRRTNPPRDRARGLRARTHTDTRMHTQDLTHIYLPVSLTLTVKRDECNASLMAKKQHPEPKTSRYAHALLPTSSH